MTETRYDDLRALFINCTLKPSPELSHTGGLIDVSRNIMRTQGMTVDVIRAVKEKTAALPVQVTWDRRQSERRAASNQPDPERRKTDRREKPPFTWDVSDFVVVAKARGRRRK